MRALASFAALLLVIGCSNAPKFQAVQSSILSTQQNVPPDPKVVAAYNEAYENCVDFMKSTRQAFAGSGNREVGLAAVGIVAGSIIVPALAAKASAAKSAIAGWGGVSGAANAAQYMLHQKGMSAAAVSEVYDKARNEIKGASANFFKAKNDQERMEAVFQLRQACDMPVLPTSVKPSEPETPKAGQQAPGGAGGAGQPAPGGAGDAGQPAPDGAGGAGQPAPDGATGVGQPQPTGAGSR